MSEAFIKHTAAATAVCLVLSCSVFAYGYETKETDDFEAVTGVSSPATLPLDDQPEFSFDARAVTLVDSATGTVLYAKNADAPRPIASITKVMTMILVARAIEEGKISLDDNVTASEHAMRQGGSQIWLEVGEIMTVDELLRAVAVASANDAAVALAEFVSGSEDAFVNEMNKEAKLLGMTDTTFKNANGLDEEGHLSSARDVAIMSAELLRHDLIRPYITTWMDELRGGETELVNTNKMLKSYNGVTGIKTGTTDDAGVCVSVSALRGDMELIAVILGSSNNAGRVAAARTLLDYGFATFELAKPAVSEQDLMPVRIKLGSEEFCEYGMDIPEYILVKKGETEMVKSEVTLPESVSAPVEKGQQIGEVAVYTNGVKTGSYPIVANEDVEKITFKKALSKLFDGLLSM